MSPELDKSHSPEFSQPYRLLAPLVLLSFPASAHVSAAAHWLDAGTERRETATDRFVSMTTK
jgi:hypothetical protein